MTTQSKNINGTVKWFDIKKRYGFIKPDDQDRDVFVHITALHKSGVAILKENTRVAFQMIQDRNGSLSAGNINIEFEKQELAKIDIINIESYRKYVRGPIIDLFSKINSDINIIRSIGPEEFEEFCLQLFSKEGYEVNRIGSYNKSDGGVDIIALKKNMGGITTKFAVQCKRSKNKISASPIRGLYGVLNKFQAHQGVLITNSYFTKNALEEKIIISSQYLFVIMTILKIALDI